MKSDFSIKYFLYFASFLLPFILDFGYAKYHIFCPKSGKSYNINSMYGIALSNKEIRSHIEDVFREYSLYNKGVDCIHIKIKSGFIFEKLIQDKAFSDYVNMAQCANAIYEEKDVREKEIYYKFFTKSLTSLYFRSHIQAKRSTNQ